ncbi:hypothetical protein ANCCEY_10982 [Ancylostoma ceylanicum]|uniref:ET module n=1 Tax=Ancylostoma ceylanicum TaxID=53326 RepID=A0A0D6LJ25_9BILA|nr:hypothetical protein ANCCEY_10982 [Ancylostoma ceylanicum]
MCTGSSVILCLLFVSTASLECHLGYSLIKGSTIGDETKVCEKDTDYCYNATAPLLSVSIFQKAGCNSVICQFIEDGCEHRDILGVPVKFCCCKNEDICNRGNMTGTTPLLDRGASVLKEVASVLG